MITDLFLPIFQMLGIDTFLLSPTTLLTEMSTLSNWFDLFRLDILVSWLIYFLFAYGTIFVLCIAPFRWFKKLLRIPKRKG